MTDTQPTVTYPHDITPQTANIWEAYDYFVAFVPRRDATQMFRFMKGHPLLDGKLRADMGDFNPNEYERIFVFNVKSREMEVFDIEENPYRMMFVVLDDLLNDIERLSGDEAAISLTRDTINYLKGHRTLRDKL